MPHEAPQTVTQPTQAEARPDSRTWLGEAEWARRAALLRLPGAQPAERRQADRRQGDRRGA